MKKKHIALMLLIGVLNWGTEFSEIMEKGGFDAVIGNPPYGFHGYQLKAGHFP